MPCADTEVPCSASMTTTSRSVATSTGITTTLSMIVARGERRHELSGPTRIPSLRSGATRADPHLNLSYYKDRTREWISVSGIATITSDREKEPRCTLRTGTRGFRRKGSRAMGQRMIPRSDIEFNT